MENFEIFVPEFEYQKKNRLWYLFFIFFSMLFILVGLLTKNYTFIALIVICATLLLMRSYKKPEIIPFAVTDKGLYFKNTHWEFKNIKSFSIFQAQTQNYFIFIPEGRTKTIVKIPVENPDILRQKLNNLVTEVEYQESLMDTIIRILGI